MNKSPYTFTSYDLLIKQAAALLDGEVDAIANMANLSALLYWSLEKINWAGFYRLQNKTLILGPFAGQPACVHLAVGKGVCGTSAASQKTLIVPDVHKFDGHIACDAASRSEMVIPLIKEGRLYGVLDLDSPIVNRFQAKDQQALESIAELFVSATNLNTLLSQ